MAELGPATHVGAPLSTVHPAIASAFAALDAASITWCLLRGGAELDSVEGDVDLLVRRADVGRLGRALAAVDDFHPESAWGRRPHRFYYGPELQDGTRVKLDVVTQLSYGRFGELPTDAAEAVLSQRIRCDGVWLPSDADAFWALLLHAVLDRGAIRDERAAELQALLPGARGLRSPLRTVLSRALPPSHSHDTVAEAVAVGAWGEVSALGPQLRLRWPGTSALSRATTVNARRVLRRAQRAQQRGSITRNRAARSTG